jgi:LacI family transcriptional regulator
MIDLCRHTGLRVPEDVCVLGVDNDELLTQISHPPVSSITLQTEKIGFESARLLDRLMRCPTTHKQVILVPPGGVIARQSTNLLAIEDQTVLTALRYIREHIHERISVEDLMEVIPVNRRFLERRFREHLGRTPLQEIRRVRIETAKKLLSETDLAMPAIARRSGFSNAERLSSVFHSMTGMTPTQYRRQFRLHDT